jgi:5-methyltetrahydrofolate--homocysteine methyltransferase
VGYQVLLGELEPEAVFEAFAAQARALERGGADAACIETMMGVEEAELAIRAVKASTALEIITTFTFNQTGPGEFHTMDGAQPAECALAALAAGASIVGANCCAGIEQMAGIARQMRAAAPAAPVMVQANAGLPEVVDGAVTYPATPAAMAAHVPELLAAGVSIIGGCCGTTPDHIRAIRAALA